MLKKLKQIKRIFSILLAMLMSVTFINPLQSFMVASADQILSMPFDNKWSSNLNFGGDDTNNELGYKIKISNDGIWNLHLITYTKDMVTYNLYDEDQVIVRESGYNLQNGTKTSPVGVSEKIALTKGTYFLRLYAYNHESVSVKLKSSFKKIKTNNRKAKSFDSSQTIKWRKKITGILGVTNKEDWYRFKVGKNTKIVLKAKSYCKTFFTYDIYNKDAQIVYNGSNELQNGSESTPASAVREITLKKGTYFLKFNKYGDGDGGKYIFKLLK